MVTNQKVAVVTGSSSGTGFETPLTLARIEFHTYATMRYLEEKSSQEEDQKALFSKATGLIGKTAEHGHCLRISDERDVLR
jgi:NAD(P)-dependent dehydrogenase (short-subunit alcohol dehydrogenase family)